MRSDARAPRGLLCEMPSVRSSESVGRRATRYTVAAVRDVTAAALRPNGSLICAASGAFAAARECLRLLGCLVSYGPLATRSINPQKPQLCAQAPSTCTVSLVLRELRVL